MRTLRLWGLGLLALWTLTGCAMNAHNFPRQASYALVDPAGSSLLARANSIAATHPGESGFRLLGNGADAFAARALLAMRAERSLDVQYYLVHDGQTTRILVNLLLAAADRGVRVRLLLDDTASRGADFNVATLAAHPNIEVRLFNPIYSGRENIFGRTLAILTHMNRLHRRMHNKLWIADSAVSVSGGRNLGDEYFGAAGDINFADVDLLSVGPVVKQLADSFDAYWNSENAVPVEAFLTKRRDEADLQRLRHRLEHYMASDRVESSAYFRRLQERDEAGYLSLDDADLMWGAAEAVWDDPEKVNSPGIPPENQLLASELLPQFERAQNSVMLVSAYFVPGEEGMAQLLDLRRRGVKVRVLTNSLQATDVPFVYGVYADYRVPLLQAGVDLYEMRATLRTRSSRNRFGIWGRSGASLHTKAMVFDDSTAFVGSFNLDPRSRFWNTEVGVVVHSQPLARELNEIVAEAFRPANSYQLILDPNDETRILYRTAGKHGMVDLRSAHAGPWKRFQSWLSNHVAPGRMM